MRISSQGRLYHLPQPKYYIMNKITKLDYIDVSSLFSSLPVVLLDLFAEINETEIKMAIVGGICTNYYLGLKSKNSDIDLIFDSNITLLKAKEFLEANLDSGLSKFETERAITFRGGNDYPIQLIKGFKFKKSFTEVFEQFDFTCCCAGISYLDGSEFGYATEEFKKDISERRAALTKSWKNNPRDIIRTYFKRLPKMYSKGLRVNKEDSIILLYHVVKELIDDDFGVVNDLKDIQKIIKK